MTSILPRKPAPDVASSIRAATRYLDDGALGYGHGTSTAADDAAWLVLESAGQSPIEEPDYQQRMTSAQLDRCEHWLRQRLELRIPVAYLVGRTWFAGLEFGADSRALVPRSPIAELILESFHGLVDTTSAFSVLDLCTGGGCIALATASLLPNAHVIGTDLSTEALTLACENRALHGLEHRVEFRQGDLFEPVSERFDLIVSNPPYVDAADITNMPEEFQSEPAIGLASGPDGLDITRKILDQAANHLQPDGVLIVEVGNSAVALEQAFPNLNFVWFDFAYGGDGVFMLQQSELTQLSTSV